MTNYDKMQELLVENGMQKRISNLFIKKFKLEESSYNPSEDIKEWAMSRGFFPSRVDYYGLNDENYLNYVPDYVDFMLHPYNNHFVIWINDKLSLKYTLGRDFANIIPEYYLYIENDGEYTYLQDSPQSIAKDEYYILNLLKEKKVLIIKPNSSKSGGEGVMKVEWVDDHIRINNKQVITIFEFQERIKDLGNNIVTEYVHQHHDLKNIWPDTECTMRIVMVKVPSKTIYSQSKWQCISCFARFGTSISGGTSNLSSGGVGVGVNFENGCFDTLGAQKMQFCPNGSWQNIEHPDTHVIWKNCVMPNWDYVRNTLYKVCNHYGSLSHLGFDVIVTDKGFVLCEINSKPAVMSAQLFSGPMLLKEGGKDYFVSKGSDKIDTTRFYTIYKQCQEKTK